MAFKINHLPVATTLQSRGRLLSLTKPVVMGILNLTPDSFYTNSRTATIDAALRTADKMLQDGALILDLGAASTRPGATQPSGQEETDRLLPVVTAIARTFPEAWLSIDTFRASVAAAAVAAGAHLINDISAGGLDADMLPTVARLKVPYIAMHMQGNPLTMQQNPTYEDVVQEVFNFLKEKVLQCHNLGIDDVLLDPGFGFGKSRTHNFSLMDHFSDLRALGCPVVCGVSRKGMIWKALGVTPETALNGTTALHMAALQQGASILRVHDVKEAVEVVRLYEAFGLMG